MSLMLVMLHCLIELVYSLMFEYRLVSVPMAVTLMLLMLISYPLVGGVASRQSISVEAPCRRST